MGFPGDLHLVDACDRAALAITLAELTAKGRFSGLVYNAGYGIPQPLDALDAVVRWCWR